MDSIVLNDNDELVIKLLHYFVTEENYSPIVLKGAKNEIWLEKLDGEYKIVRLVSNYIHNNAQLDVDIFRTSQIMKRIKKKTMSFNINALSIFINLGENVDIKNVETDNIDLVNIKSIEDLNGYDFVIDEFPTITKKTEFEEQGFELFMKLTSDIGKKSEDDAKKAEDIFTKKTPIVTYILLILNIVMFVLAHLYGTNEWATMFANHIYYIKAGQIYRLITAAFTHVGLLHLAFNMYALYIIGPQLENFFGKFKFTLIYLISGICGNLLSAAFNTGFSLGASGAIFGLLGALLYFGYHYRVYLDSVIKSQILPLIVLNLVLGFLDSSIDSFGHIGGLVGGALAAWAVGVKYKSTKGDKINGFIMLAVYIGFITYLIISK